MKTFRKITFAAALALFAAAGTNFSAVAQQNPEAGQVYTEADQLPVYLNGGEEGLFAHIVKNVKYPEDAMMQDIQGRVFVSFVVDKEGNVVNPKVEKGIGGGCDEESVRVVQLLDKFSPAVHNGEAVAYRYVMPIKFQLTGKEPKKKKKDRG